MQFFVVYAEIRKEKTAMRYERNSGKEPRILLMEKSVSDGRKTGAKNGARTGRLDETAESTRKTTELKP
ncbi:hypothetical protein ACROYT_G033696 [Oculina patagonica]